MENIKKLKEDIPKLKEKQPSLRQRDLAHRIGISEAELLSLNLKGTVIRLDGDWKSLLVEVKEMGYVMALTRNEHCVHERKGIYDNITFYGGPHNMGVAVNPDIDLRLFMNEWEYGFAVEMERGNTKLYSLQFFNDNGESVHKIFTTPKSNIEGYMRITEKYRASDQDPIHIYDRDPKSPKTPLPDEQIDQNGFKEAWRNLQDTHDFFGLLKDFGVTRTQGLRLAPEGFATKVDNEAVVRALSKASERELSIMCFVHSRGCIQIHTGPVKNLKFYGEWYNVMDPKFNLHLLMTGVEETWIVKKPTSDGIVTSLELFDKEGNQIVYFFGARKPGKPELEEWRELIKEIQTPGVATV